MMVGMDWRVLGACKMTIYKRSYIIPFDVNPKLSSQEAVDESVPLDPLERPLNVGRGGVHHHHEGGEKYSKAIQRGNDGL